MRGNRPFPNLVRNPSLKASMGVQPSDKSRFPRTAAILKRSVMVIVRKGVKAALFILPLGCHRQYVRFRALSGNEAEEKHPR